MEFSELPAAESCRLIDFENTEVVPGIVNETWILIVSGTKNYANMDIKLAPRIYAKQPEYWGIEVVACLTGMGLPALAPYSASLPLDGIRGKKGIEIIGATCSKKIDL